MTPRDKLVCVADRFEHLAERVTLRTDNDDALTAALARLCTISQRR